MWHKCKICYAAFEAEQDLWTHLTVSHFQSIRSVIADNFMELLEK